MPHQLRFLANCSLLFTERPLLERPAAAKAAGFDAIELWWPWADQPVPADADVDALVGARGLRTPFFTMVRDGVGVPRSQFTRRGRAGTARGRGASPGPSGGD